MSNDTADQEIIDRLQSVDKSNRQLIEENVKLANYTFNIQKQAFHKIINAIKEVRSELLTLADITNRSQYQIALSNAIHSINMILSRHYQILSIINKILRGNVDVNIIDIIGEDILISNFREIAKDLGKGESLPFEISSETLFSLLSACNLDVKISNHAISINIHLPIIQKRQMEHFQILPLPFKLESKMFTLTGLAENISINKIKNTYLLISNGDMGLFSTN